MGILDVCSVFGCGLVVAIIAVIAGILWERSVRQNRKSTKVAKVIQPSAAAHSEPEIARENKSNSPSTDCLHQSSVKDGDAGQIFVKEIPSSGDKGAAAHSEPEIARENKSNSPSTDCLHQSSVKDGDAGQIFVKEIPSSGDKGAAAHSRPEIAKENESGSLLQSSVKDGDAGQIFIKDIPSTGVKCTTTSSHSELQVSPGQSLSGTGVDCPSSSLPKILQNSEKVSSGSPSVFKLPTKIALQRQKGMIIRKSVGSPGNVVGEGTEKVLMVVGATGAGKTTLINGMVNYILGVQWKDDFRYKLIVEDDKGSQANSQTKHITAYTFYPMKGSAVPYTFTIIDTPGFGDTEGLERDRQITDQIKEFFSISPPDGIDHLDGIGFVTQASLARLTPTQEYIFDSILSIFGKDVARNIFMLVTFADGQKPPVMDAIKKANIPSQKYYKFNNSALFADNTDEIEESFDAMFWKMVFRSFKNFFIEFEKSQSVSLQLTQEVLKEREQLQNLIEGLNPQITMGLGKIEEMRQEENILKQRETEIETNRSFTYTVEVTKPYEENLRGTGRHTTTCLRCNFTCHENCAFANDDDKRSCCAMGSNGNCTVCTKHCYWSEHKNLPYIIRYKKETETRTSDDLKMKYETAVSGKTKVQGMIDQLEEYLVKVHTTVMGMIVKAQQSLRRLDEIALKPNPLTQLQYLELLIESEKNEAKPGWQKRVQYYEEAKRQAEILSKVKDVKAAEKEIKEKARSGEKWYSRFKFW